MGLRTVIITFMKAAVKNPDARGLRPMRTPRSSQHLFLRCPSPFGVLRGPFCQPCHRVCFRAQWSPASAYLKVHPETLWPWNARPLRGGFSERSVQMLPVGTLFQDVVLTAQLDRVWLIVLPHLSMGTREACSTAAFEV